MQGPLYCNIVSFIRVLFLLMNKAFFFYSVFYSDTFLLPRDTKTLAEITQY